MSTCIYDNSDCSGRVEWDHVWIYAGRQINEWFAILPTCYYHHRGGGLDRNYSQYVSLNRLDDMQLWMVQEKYPHADWFKLKKKLDKKFGPKT